MLIPHYTRVRDWLLEALPTDPRQPSEDDLLYDLTHNRAQLWPGRSAAIVSRLERQVRTTFAGADTRIRVVPTIVLWLAGGDLKGVLELQPGIEAWARAQGAVDAAIYARKGWSRVMARHGFKTVDGELRLAL
jgi:hypothetical protein